MSSTTILTAQRLSSPDWEEGVASWVNGAPPEKLIAWLLTMIQATPAGQDKEAMQCVMDIRRWLAGHDDDCRWQIFQQAETLGFSTPTGAVGLAVFWLGGSMTPSEFEPVYAEPHLVPVMLNTAIKLLSIGMAEENPPFTGAEQLWSSWCAVQGGA